MKIAISNRNSMNDVVYVFSYVIYYDHKLMLGKEKAFIHPLTAITLFLCLRYLS